MNSTSLGPLYGANICPRSCIHSQTSRVGLMFISNYDSLGILWYVVFLQTNRYVVQYICQCSNTSVTNFETHRHIMPSTVLQLLIRCHQYFLLILRH